MYIYAYVNSQISATPEEESKYTKLMNTLAWFFFKLFVFGYVEDLETGMAFRFPGGFTWRIFIEVHTYIFAFQVEVQSNLVAVYFITICDLILQPRR